MSYSESFPLDGSLTLGLGANRRRRATTSYYIPVGISLGRRFDLEGSNTTFVPYVHPVIVPTFGGGDSDVNFALGLGVDIRFSEQWAVRASGGLGDIEGVGISVAVPPLTPTAIETPGRGPPRPGVRRSCPKSR